MSPPLSAPSTAPDWWLALRRDLSVDARVKVLAELHAKGWDIGGWPT